MESKKINQLATELSPDLSDLTIIGDPTTGVSKKITLSQMASLFTGTIEEYANLAAFPLVGVSDTIYIALDTNVIYRWDTSSYVVLSPNIISSLVFGDANGFDGTISLVGSVATLTITTALTLGSLPFIGASGALTQDNANLFYDDTNNRLGIATNAPTTPLDVFGSGIIARINGTSTNNGFLGFANEGTNKWSVGNVQSDHRFRIYSEANSAELISLLQTGEFGIGIANPTTKLHLDGGASALIANLDANVSVAKSLSFRSDNSNRINLEVSGTESGSNVGADLFIRRYTDLGALIDTPLTITRSTGLITLATALSGTSATFSGTITSTFVGQFLENTGASTSAKIIRISNTGADMAIGIEGSTPSEIPSAEGGIAYSTVLKSVGSTSLILGTLSKAAIVINTSQQVTLKQGLTGTTANFTGQLTLGSTITNGTYTYTLPSATGTLALTSALSSYLPLSGGTLTGALSGTSATFTGLTVSLTSGNIARFSSAIAALGTTAIGLGYTDGSGGHDMVKIFGQRVNDGSGRSSLILAVNAVDNDQSATVSDAKITISGSTGNITLASALSGTSATFSSGISVGGATATTGGIEFPATQVAIASANNLDDYEEGTWTPGLKFAASTAGITYSAQSGTYTKIGRQVTVNGFFTLSNKGAAAGQAVITGLPFTIANTSGNYSVANFRFSVITYSGTLTGLAFINDTSIGLEQTSEAGSLTDILNTNFANNSSIILSLTYFV